MDLQHELARHGLDRTTRLLCLTVAAVFPAEWLRLHDILRLARASDCSRAAFEESLLQATLFFGFPRVVSAFERLQESWPVTDAPCGGEVPAAERRERGLALFAGIYGKNDEAVRRKLAGFHQAFHDFVVEAAYGRVLCRPGLDVTTRELLAVTALNALGQEPQLLAHARGAVHFGASEAAVLEAARCGNADATRLEQLRLRLRPRPSSGC